MENVNVESCKDVAIVGGASLVGSHLIELLEAERPNWTVTVLDNFRNGVEEMPPKQIPSSRVKVVYLDVREPDAVRDALAEKDVVFHMAALLSMAFPTHPREAVEVNILGSLNVVEACCTTKSRLVFSSSSGGVYGCPPFGNVEEVTPFWHDTLPPGTAMYGSAKILIESVCRDRSVRVGDLEWVALRYTSVFGRRQHRRGRNTAKLRDNLIRLHRGESAIFDRPALETHDYVHARDVAVANLLASEITPSPNRAYTIGAGQSTTNEELDHILKAVTHSRVPTQWLGEESEMRPNVTFDISRANRDLGYTPRVSLEEGITDLYKEIVEGENG